MSPACTDADLDLRRSPLLYQINTRVWLTELGRTLGRPATLDDVPDGALDRLAEAGFHWIWFLSVWRTGEAGQRISRANREWRKEFKETLPDLREEDIEGSGFAIAGYTVSPSLGGDSALARLRRRLRSRGLRLMLDFVPNHTGVDHPWVQDHPTYYVAGSELDLAREPRNYSRAKCKGGDTILAFGRDPHFPGWSDTFQLNYGNQATQEAMIGQLLKVAGQCDGVRCDMAMLILPEVFERTWGIAAPPFWPAAVGRVKEKYPDFCFMAEVYWDLERTLQKHGFDYTYDKRLYDCLREGRARPVREHLTAELDYQKKLARFLENHDEPRAAATFALGMHESAAVITYLSPGLRFFHQGQLEGRRKRISPHLIRAPVEKTDEPLRRFYDRLLEVLRQPVVRHGEWRLLDCVPAWEDNPTWDCFLAWSWRRQIDERRLIAVNYASHRSQCYVRLPFPELAPRTIRFKDLMSAACYDRNGRELSTHGLYLDLAPWGFHVFEVAAL